MVLKLNSAVCVWFYYFYFISNFDFVACVDQLVYLQTLSRHGARSPLCAAYPTDDYNETSWPQGYGQLTQHGVEQMIDVGKFTRLRYVEGRPYAFLSSSYMRKEMYAQSSDVDRTLMSSQSFLDGLYPFMSSGGGGGGGGGQHFMPIPVHTTQASLDKELMNDDCKEYDVVLKQVVSSQDVEDMRKAYVEVFQFLSEQTKVDIQSIENVISIVDNFICKVANNYSLPAWTTLEYENKSCYHLLLPIKDNYFTYRFNRRNLAKLKSGLLLGSIVDRMLRKVFNSSAVVDAVDKQGETRQADIPQQTEQPDKAYFYISHDTTMAGLTGALKVFNNRDPPFAATLFIELHRYENISDNNFTIDHATLKNIVGNISNSKYDITNDVNKYYVTLLYRNETENIEKQPYKLVIPGCEERCAFAKFLYLTHDNVVTNWQETCFPSSNESQTTHKYTWTVTLSKNGAMMTMVISCIIFVLLLLLIVAYLVVKCRSYKTYRKYVDLPTEIN